MRWSRHSRRRVPITRSATALARGARTGLSSVSMPRRRARDGEEIGRPNPRAVVGQERPPGLAGRAGWLTAAIAADRAIARDDPELQEFAADALGAPERVVARHNADEFARLSTEARPAEAGAGLPPPEELPGLAMPADHRLRPYQLVAQEQVL